MNSVLYKYRDESEEYLIYDLEQNEDRVDADRARNLLAQNFGLRAKGILAGPVPSEEGPKMKLFTPDGREQVASGDCARFGRRFLQDAGYVPGGMTSTGGAGGGADICFAGKVFVFR